MNSRILSLVLVTLAAAVAAPAQTADVIPAPPAARAYNVTHAGPYVERGTARIQVLAKLGEPANKLSPDVWIFRGYRPVSPARADATCGLLVVFFRDGWVSDLKLTNPAGAEVLIAEHLALRHETTYAQHETSRRRDE